MPTQTDPAILDEFRRAGGLLEGHFILSSGLHSPRYLQCAPVLSDPKRAERLGGALAAKLEGTEIDLVVGPALGAVIVAHEVARALGVRAIFTERKEGRMVLRRQFRIAPEERVLLVEDAMTTGGSLRDEVAPVVREAGGRIVAVAALVDRTAHDPGFGVPVVSLLRLQVPTYEPGPETCPLCGQGIPAVKPGSSPKAKGAAEPSDKKESGA